MAGTAVAIQQKGPAKRVYPELPDKDKEPVLNALGQALVMAGAKRVRVTRQANAKRITVQANMKRLKLRVDDKHLATVNIFKFFGIALNVVESCEHVHKAEQAVEKVKADAQAFIDAAAAEKKAQAVIDAAEEVATQAVKVANDLKAAQAAATLIQREADNRAMVADVPLAGDAHV